jgi:hypothetical protein
MARLPRRKAAPYVSFETACSLSSVVSGLSFQCVKVLCLRAAVRAVLRTRGVRRLQPEPRC